MRTLVLAVFLLASPATFAEDAPLTADQFDALTKGTTFDTYDSGSIYGIEKFLPDRRSIWQDAERCMYGIWAQVGDQICFTYEDDPANPDCWTYFQTEEGIIGHLNGDETVAPITLLPSVTKMTCDDYIGA